MTKVTLTKNVEIKDTIANIEFNSEDKGFVKAQEAYVEACDVRNQYAGTMVTETAMEAKTLFVENEAVTMVTGSMAFGDSTMSSTIYKEFTLDNGDVVKNHLVFGCEDDYSSMVSEAIGNVFDGEEAE